MESGRSVWLPVVSVLLGLIAAYVGGFLVIRSRYTGLDTTGQYRGFAIDYDVVWWLWHPCIVIDEKVCQTTWLRIG